MKIEQLLKTGFVVEAWADERQFVVLISRGTSGKSFRGVGRTLGVAVGDGLESLLAEEAECSKSSST